MGTNPIAAALLLIAFSRVGVASGDLFGVSLAVLGDIDDDGIPELAVGAPRDASQAGTIWIFRGKDGAVIHRLEGDRPGVALGWHVCGPGDLTGDGVPDLAVGGEEVRVYSGRDGRTWSQYGGPRKGTIAAVGDVNRDGCADLLVMGPRKVVVVSGCDGSVLRETDRFDWGDGALAAGIGDADGDGSPDYAVGGSRLVVVLSGSDGSVLHRFPAAAGEEDLGRTVAGAGDVDGDGRSDVILGFPQDVFPTVSEPGPPPTSARVFSGRDGRELVRVAHPRRSEDFGRTVAACGDVDEDGHEDFLVADEGLNLTSGCVRLHSGLDGTVLREWKAATSDRHFGYSVTSADFDGDGTADVAIGVVSPWSPDLPGAVRVYSGKTGRELYGLTRARAEGPERGAAPETDDK